jgi:RNA polymerase sigma-70 factor (ECF subfamily)
MRNAWLNQLRHNRNGPQFVDLDSTEQSLEQVSNPYVLYLRKLEREQVREAIEGLPVAYREIIVLRDLEGFSYQEIATVLQCPAGTVMSRLGRAREKLRKALSTKHPKARVKAI